MVFLNVVSLIDSLTRELLSILMHFGYVVEHEKILDPYFLCLSREDETLPQTLTEMDLAKLFDYSIVIFFANY